MVKKIATQAVYVENQKMALEFWIEKMGFEKGVELDMGNGSSWLEVAPKGAESSLVLYPRNLMTDWKERKPSIVFVCDNIEKFCADIKQKGVEFKQELNEMPWGKFAIIADNDHNEFVLKG